MCTEWLQRLGCHDLDVCRPRWAAWFKLATLLNGQATWHGQTESTTMTSPLKVGLLGFGYASATFHAPLIAAVPGLQLTAISSSRAQDVHAAWPGVAVCDTPESLIARPDIDLVVVATPNNTHAPLAALALRAGKHVVVDKPFTLNVQEARDLIVLAKQQARLLSVFHNRRWDGDFLSLQAVLNAPWCHSAGAIRVSRAAACGTTWGRICSTRRCNCLAHPKRFRSTGHASVTTAAPMTGFMPSCITAICGWCCMPAP